MTIFQFRVRALRMVAVGEGDLTLVRGRPLEGLAEGLRLRGEARL